MASFVKITILVVASLLCFVRFTTGQAVTGIPVPTGTPVPARLEIRTFIQDSTRLNIFYLALSRMQATSTTQLLSYYRITGIHGTGFAWNGDTGGPFGFSNGFCRHSDVLFPTWHRPYLSLYEKTLLDLATSIVNTFPAGTVRDRHIASLRTWRLPYWDWARDASIPSVINSLRNVVVTTVQNGVLVNTTIRNPLYSYRVDPNDDNTRVNTNARTIETVRNPTIQSSTYVSRPTVTNNNMISQGATLRSNVYQAMTTPQAYNDFASNGGNGFSIEGSHGSVHVIVGGPNGHMRYVPYAAFDPIFFLHHANVDRLTALWQVLNPTSYLSTQGTLNANTPLYPFRQANGAYWTSALARNVAVFGYTYPELINCGQSVICVRAAINSLYGSITSKKKRQTDIDSGAYYEYAIRVKIHNSAANGSFAVNFYLGEPSYTNDDYMVDPNYIGSVGVFTPSSIPKSKKKAVYGTMSLSPVLKALVDAGKLKNTQPNTVKAYVQDKLKWNIDGNKNEDTGDYDLDECEIDIITAKVKPPKDEYSFPEWGGFSKVYKVT